MQSLPFSPYTPKTSRYNFYNSDIFDIIIAFNSFFSAATIPYSGVLSTSLSLLYRLTFVKNFLSRRNVLKPHVILLIEVSYIMLNLPWDLGRCWKWVLGHVITVGSQDFCFILFGEIFPLRVGRPFPPTINKPFLRKGLIGPLVHCTNTGHIAGGRTFSSSWSQLI